MAKINHLKSDNLSKGNSEDSLLVIYILRILKTYSSPNKPLSTQMVMEYLNKEYSIGCLDNFEAQKKKVRRHLDTLCAFYGNHCIIKQAGKTRQGHDWYYDSSRDGLAKEEGKVQESLSKEEIDFIIDMITSSKLINVESTRSIINKLLKKTDLSKEEIVHKLQEIDKESWPKNINNDLVLLKQEIQSYIDSGCKMTFDYDKQKSVSATPYGWDSNENGQYVLVAKVDGEADREFSSFLLEEIRNVQKGDWNYDYDESYYDLILGKPNVLSMDSLFINIRKINGAIKEKCGLSFEYLCYVIDDENVVLGGKNKNVMPHSLVFTDGKYYLIGYDEQKESIDYFRVDLISKLNLSKRKIKISDWNEVVLSGIQRAREVEKHPLMFVGKDYPITFKVMESALDRVIDAFGKKPDELEVLNETRSVSKDLINEKMFGNSSEDEPMPERVVKVDVRTTYEEAFRWALANADAVEVCTQEVRDGLRRIAEPIHQFYKQTLPDKVQENLDFVYEKGIFAISSKVDEETALKTYKELKRRKDTDVVKKIVITSLNSGASIEYLGEFVKAEGLCIMDIPECDDVSWAENLTELTSLELINTQITDVSWLKNAKKLNKVILDKSPIADLSVLSEHKNITYLDICDTNVTDISFIEQYNRLSTLLMVRCRVKDVAPLFRVSSNISYIEVDETLALSIDLEKLKDRHIGLDFITRKDSEYWYLFL